MDQGFEDKVLAGWITFGLVRREFDCGRRCLVFVTRQFELSLGQRVYGRPSWENHVQSSGLSDTEFVVATDADVCNCDSLSASGEMLHGVGMIVTGIVRKRKTSLACVMRSRQAVNLMLSALRHCRDETFDVPPSGEQN